MNAKKTTVETIRGQPFCVAYLFPEYGTHIFVGALENIEKSARTQIPLCHGIVHLYKAKKVNTKIWRLFGKFQSDSPIAGRFNLVRVPRIKRVPQGFHLSNDNIRNIIREKHTVFVLFKWRDAEGDVEVIKRYRNLPSVFLKDLVSITSNVPRKINRYSLLRGF